jgi:zeta-carotene desaturase
LVGAYHYLLNYLELIGTRHLLTNHSKLRLPLYHPEKGFTEFQIKKLPKPLHLTAGLMSFQLFSMADRKHIVSIGLELQRFDSKTEEKLKYKTIDQWLDDHRQSVSAKKNFWYPIALSVMNELPERASALLFARSLNKTFFGSKYDSAILIPKVGQNELYSVEAAEYLRKRKCRIDLNSEVVSFVLEDECIAGARLSNGELIKARAVISTVPSHGLLKILPVQLRETDPFKLLGQMESSPIISFHLWFDNAFMNIDYVGCIDLNLQWIFNRRRIFDDHAKIPHYLSAVISGAHAFIEMSKEDLLKLALKDIHCVFPASRRAKLLRSLIIKEKRATFSATPAAEAIRLDSVTSIRNFFLAGDWTATGYPATIEGAVLSGYRAANLVLKH